MYELEYINTDRCICPYDFEHYYNTVIALNPSAPTVYWYVVSKDNEHTIQRLGQFISCTNFLGFTTFNFQLGDTKLSIPFYDFDRSDIIGLFGLSQLDPDVKISHYQQKSERFEVFYRTHNRCYITSSNQIKQMKYRRYLLFRDGRIESNIPPCDQSNFCGYIDVSISQYLKSEWFFKLFFGNPPINTYKIPAILFPEQNKTTNVQSPIVKKQLKQNTPSTPEKFICPITLDLMLNPYICEDGLHMSMMR